MSGYVASIDCGTTSARFIVFDATAKVIVTAQLEFEQIFPQPGHMEERPQDIMDAINKCIEQGVDELEKKGIKKSEIKGVGITNQRETACVWSRKTGKPLYNAIVWPDTRNTGTVRQLAAKSDKGVDAIKAKTGLPISTYFAGVKLKWMLDNVDAVKEAHDSDDLMFGTVDTWILWSLTGGLNGGLFLTDVTNASRTMFMSLKTLSWDDELLEFFGVKKSCLAEIVSNAEVYGKMSSGALQGVPIAGLIGDQQGALAGQKCLAAGEAKNTYGTGCFMLYHTGKEVVPSNHGLLTTVAYKAGKDATPQYALEGSIAVAGSSIKWTRDNLNLIDEADQIGKFAVQVDDTGGVYFVTGFSGLFAPYWDDTATGMLIGITGYTTKHHIARATLEATCFQTKAILDSMQADSGAKLAVLRVDGGMTNSDPAMQIQADILGIEVERPVMRESTAFGSALMAGHALGLFGWDLTNPKSLENVNVQGKTVFKSHIDSDRREKMYKGWNRAVERSKGWNIREEDKEAEKEAKK